MSDPIDGNAQPAQPPGPVSAKTSLGEKLTGFWTWLRPHAARLSLLTAGAVIGSAGLFFLMGETDVTNDYLPKRWNESIQRLGIEPVYPPQEDIYVGDIIAEIVDSGHKFKSLPVLVKDSPFIGRYVKITQIPNLRGYFGVKSEAPYFGDSVWLDDKRTLSAAQPRVEVATDGTASGVEVKDALFPVIKIERKEGIVGLLRNIAFGGARADVEEIELQNVQTYAINAFHAQNALMAFCNDEYTEVYCADEYLRAKLSYILKRDILETAETEDCGPRYLYDIRLFVVRQAFLTRGVKVTNGRGRLAFLDAGGDKGDLQNDMDRAATAATTSPQGQLPEPENIADNKSSFRRTNSSGLFSDRQFARPLVVGFNSVSIGMRNSTPAWLDAAAKAAAGKDVKDRAKICASSLEVAK
ncbi:hypothetical protein [Rhizobium sp. AN70]|uniref:hypothetical protein n=1 Tax=Rhizobium sp. AN70 TaxID=3035123 RepID=UPI00247ADD21|nr:hypothetical protein [Rhizobium sp. AN70]MDH7800931.1 hypothetical protein [Rhizobium sp. AN70]